MNKNQHIDYRAWSQYHGTMFDPEYIRDATSGMIKAANAYMADPDSHAPGGIFLPTDDVDLIILQYTRVNETDTGRKIFEGDIVDYDDSQVFGAPDRINELRGVVEMSEGCWWITNKAKQQSVRLWSETAAVKIVGNIYENPELLES